MYKYIAWVSVVAFGLSLANHAYITEKLYDRLISEKEKCDKRVEKYKDMLNNHILQELKNEIKSDELNNSVGIHTGLFFKMQTPKDKR